MEDPTAAFDDDDPIDIEPLDVDEPDDIPPDDTGPADADDFWSWFESRR